MNSEVAQTERLYLRRLTLEDAPFILELLNEWSFIEFIGDKKVRDLDDARRYLEEGAIASYAQHGFGPYLVARKDDAEAIGICGLYQRSTLAEPDLGFAFLEAYTGRGYAEESARAVVGYAAECLNLRELAAIVNAGNRRSVRLLGRLGFEFRNHFKLPDEEVSLHCYICSTGKRSDRLG